MVEADEAHLEAAIDMGRDFALYLDASREFLTSGPMMCRRLHQDLRGALCHRWCEVRSEREPAGRMSLWS